MLYTVTFTINIPQMLAYIPYMDPIGYIYMHKSNMWLFRKMGVPPIIHSNRCFHCKPSSYWGTSIYGKRNT